MKGGAPCVDNSVLTFVSSPSRAASQSCCPVIASSSLTCLPVRKSSSDLGAVSNVWFLLTLAILFVILFHRPISIFLLRFGLLEASLQ